MGVAVRNIATKSEIDVVVCRRSLMSYPNHTDVLPISGLTYSGRKIDGARVARYSVLRLNESACERVGREGMGICVGSRVGVEIIV